MQIFLTTIAPALLSGLIGAFVGAFVGAYVTARHQREQWVDDRKREEYRELLVNLSDAMGTVRKGPEYRTPAQVQEALLTVIRTDQSCIFTSPTLDRIKVIDRFTNALTVHSEDREKSLSIMKELYSDIRKAAREDVGLKPE